MRALFFCCIAFITWPSQALAQSADSLGQENLSLPKTPSKTKTIVRIFAVPVALIGFGLYTQEHGHLLNRYAVRDWRNENFPDFFTSADDVLQFVPIGVVYGLDLLNVKAKNDLVNRSLLLAKSEILMTVMVRVLKYTTDVTRPDGGSNSFPSGHTAQAFVAATFMHKELGHKSVWYSIGAYSMAATVGFFRILNNDHWISDVLAGAGFGILSTNIAYATHRYRWGKRPNLTVVPTYSNGPGIYFSWRIGNK